MNLLIYYPGKINIYIVHCMLEAQANAELKLKNYSAELPN